MAKKKKLKDMKSESGKVQFEFSAEKRQKIWGILAILLSVFILLSVLSYSENDNDKLNLALSGMKNSAPGNDVTKLYPNLSEPLPASAEIHNWLGIVGAYLSYFLVHKSVGYFSLFYAALLLLWGVGQFKEIDLRKKLNYTAFFLLMSLFGASFFGLFSNESYGFSGNVGYYIAKHLTILIGWVGAFLALLVCIIILLMYAFDVKLETVGIILRGLFKRTPVEPEPSQEKTQKKAAVGNGQKKTKAQPEQKKTETLPSTQDGGDDPEPEPVTEITVKKKPAIESKVKSVTMGAAAESELSDNSETAQEMEVNSTLQDRSFSKKADNTDNELEAERGLPEPWEEQIEYTLPTVGAFLQPPPESSTASSEEEWHEQAEQLKAKLALFDIQIEKIEVTPGPVLALYELTPAPGVRIARIVSLTDDIALALKAKGIRIIAPLPGRGTIGIEIPNQHAQLVVAHEVLSGIENSKDELPIALGKTISGDNYVTDLAKMPHLLIAGSTGSGKSVGINMIIAGMLFSRKPDWVKFAIIDPKKIELTFYKNLRKHYLAKCPDIREDIVTSPMDAVILLKSVVLEMEKRYTLLSKAAAKNIIEYNAKFSDPIRRPRDTDEITHHVLPYIVVIIDELADLMITAAKEVEEPITRLAQLARAVGIHLVLATQRPSVNVITGVIKANFSTRISYQVASKIDSRTILDMNGAEQLLGRGDMLFMSPGSAKPVRMQNAFISTQEVELLMDYIKDQKGYSKPYSLPSIYEQKGSTGMGNLEQYDQMFTDAAKLIVQHQQGSVTLLQRRLSLGYARAAKVMDQLEEAGVVGPNNGSKARLVLVDNVEQLETILRSL